MKFEKEVHGDVVVIRIDEKKLTSQEAPEMKTALLSFMEGEGEIFVLDLSKVDYMDSTGLGSFLFGVRQGDRYDKDLIFTHLSKRIMSLMHIANLDEMLEIYDTVEEALTAIEEDKAESQPE